MGRYVPGNMAPAAPPQTTIEAVGVALNIRKGDGFVDKVMPAFLCICYVALFIVRAFVNVPNESQLEALQTLLGPFLGVYVVRAGQKD